MTSAFDPPTRAPSRRSARALGALTLLAAALAGGQACVISFDGYTLDATSGGAGGGTGATSSSGGGSTTGTTGVGGAGGGTGGATSSTGAGGSTVCDEACPVPCEGGVCSAILAVQAGGVHTCALVAGGAVWCWGDNAKNQLGQGNQAPTQSSKPLHVIPPVGPIDKLGTEVAKDAIELAAGTHHTCMRMSDHTVWCWGDNVAQQLGQYGGGSAIPRRAEDSNGNIIVADTIVGGLDNVCADGPFGGWACWGSNVFHQIGRASVMQTICLAQPVLASENPWTMLPAKTITIGARHMCAIVLGDTVACWGDNQKQQIVADGTVWPTPVNLPAPKDVVALAAGNLHTCAIVADGKVQCWGDDTFGQLGGGVGAPTATPQTIAGLADATALAAGSHHTCAIVAGGKVKCWGANNHGQLGDGTADPKQGALVDVVGVDDAKAITVADDHTCVRRADGILLCWGANDHGQLGNGAIADFAGASAVRWK